MGGGGVCGGGMGYAVEVPASVWTEAARGGASTHRI